MLSVMNSTLSVFTTKMFKHYTVIENVVLFFFKTGSDSSACLLHFVG